MLEDILITEELSRRAATRLEGLSRLPNWQAEAQAMQTLARQMASGSQTLLQSLVEKAAELCQAGSAGISLLERTPDGEEIFRWIVLAGTLAPYVGTTTPCNFSPCGVCLDRLRHGGVAERGTPVLFSYPERYFTYLRATNTPSPEDLVLPLISDGHTLGTLWIMSHDEQRHFDSEDVRVMTYLADFAVTALLLKGRQTQELVGANAFNETLEERNHVALEAAQLATWDWHIPTNRVVWNKRHYRLLGLEPGQGEETADSFIQSIHSEDLHAVSEQLERALSQCSIYQADFRIVRADTQEIRWMSGYGRVMETQNGRATRMAGVMFDSTERQRVEAQLRSAQRRLELSVTGANLGIWTYNVSTDEFWADARTKQMHGHEPHEVHTFAEAGANIHPEDRDRCLRAIAQAIQDGSKLQLEYRVIWGDDSVHGIASYAEFIQTGEPNGGMFYGVVQDISDRLRLEGDLARAEAALRESEEKYRSLFNSIDKAFVVQELLYDDAGRPFDVVVLESNPNSERIAGTPGAVGKRATELYPNTDQPWFETYAQVVETGEPMRLVVLEAQMGKWLQLYISRIGGEAAAAFAAVFNDITERKRTEENLAFLAEVSQDLTRLTNIDETMDAIGAKIGEYFGLSLCLFVEIDEASEIGVVNYGWHRDDALRISGAYRIGDFVVPEFERMSRNGEAVVVRDTFADPLTDAERCAALKIGSFVTVPLMREGEWRFWLGAYRSEAHDWRDDEIELLRELTTRIWTRLEHARAEAALRVSEEKYRTLFNSMDEAYAVVEVIPNEEGRWSDFRFLEVNPAFVRHTSMKHPIGRTATQILGTPNPHWAEIYGQVSETGEAVRIEMMEAALNRVFDLNIFRLGDSGSRRVAVLFTDITERKRAEDDRNRAQEAMQAFFSNVSHEFRTPLTLLLSSIQETLSDLAHPLSPAQRSQLELAHRNAMRLLTLVNTLLDVSRIEAGRIQAVYEPTDLATLTTELASSFESAIQQAGLQLMIDCSPLPEPVYVDRSMWEKIVLNLLSNTFKFTFAGEITVRLRLAGNWVELTVQDTGIGIAAAELPRLFERFYQVKGAKGRSFEGSGIGLSLVQELIKLHSGTITVSSTQGEGSCFKVSIPIGFAHLPPQQIGSDQTLTSTATGVTAYVEEALGWLPQEYGEFLSTGAGEQKSLISPLPRTTRILLVDDNADMCAYLKRLLSERSQVETAANGTIALKLIQQHPPDLVLTDVMMPQMDGLQLLRTLRADPQTKSIPVILLSARAGEEATIEGLAAGADDYLIKPFSARELISRVETHLQLALLRQEQSANRFKHEFLLTVTHELQAPLVTILGWARLLQTKSFDADTTAWALAKIERNATIEAKLIKDLLDVSSLLSGKFQLKPQLVDLVSLVQNVIETFCEAAQAKSIQLVETISNVTQIGILADGDRLKQIISNLLDNAIKFTPKGGRVEIQLTTDAQDSQPPKSTPVPPQREPPSSDWLPNSPQTVAQAGIPERGGSSAEFAQITVTDTGIGIRPEFLPYVFERFTQAEVPSRHSPGGVGIGLAIARLLVELHHGTIEVASAGEGRGATFTVLLPLITFAELNNGAK